MNQLTEFLVNSILEEDKKEIIGIFGGGFKPPIKGHVAIVQKALQDFPELDKLIVSVGSGVRDEIDQEESLLVWDIYQHHLPMKVEIGASKSGMPIKDIYKLAKENPDKTIYWFIGAREGREDDLQDIAARTKSADKYGNLQVKVVTTSDPNVSGTNARKALLARDKEKFFTFLPDFIADEEKEEIYTILRPAVKETSNPQDGKAAPYGSGYDEIKEKKDPKKGTGKKPKGSGRRLYTDEDPKDTVGVKFSSRQDIVDTLNKKSFKAKSHARQSQIINLIHQRVRAAYNRAKDPDVKKRLKTALDYAEQRKEASKAKTQRLKKQKLNEHSMGDSIDLLPYLSKLTQHMIDKGYNIEPLPGLKLIDDDFENAEDFFGKTAYYDPVGQIIVLYTHGRHPKDIARSYAHEMIHHIQNLENRLGNITTTNTQEDDHLNDIEAEANLKGTMTFRNWTDSLTENLTQDIPQYFYHATYKPLLPSIKKTGLDTSEAKLAWEDSEPGIVYLANDPYVAESYAETSEMVDDEWLDEIIILKVASKDLDLSKLHDDRNVRSDEPSDTFEYHGVIPWNVLKLYKEDINEKGFDKKLDKDPFGLNQYARELAQGLEEAILNEGRYDKFVNEISRIVFEMFKDIHDRGDKKGEFEFRVGDPEDEETDIPSKDFEFDLAGVVKITDDLYKVDGGANAGFDDDGEEIQPLLSVKFHIPKNPDWQKVSFDIKDVVRHELEHLTQDGENVKGVVVDPKDPRLDRPGKQMDDDQFIRDMIDADMLPKADYFKLKKEIDAMMQGLYYKAKKSRRPFKDVIDDYLATQPISQEEKEEILNLWRSRNKALNLPVFENEEKVMDYVIYSDMDGVLSDFDKRFMQFSDGIRPNEYEAKYGSSKFWELIDSKVGVPFWAGMDWMPDGKEYWDYIEKYNPIILSAPSRNNESRYGKRIWKKRNMPSTKMILAYASDKKNYARENAILIDDRKENIDQWEAEGGIGILHTSAANTIAQLQKLGL